jgi:dihydroorotate dehydrogenase
MYFKTPSMRSREVMGLSFPHTVGLAAGLDKNGDYLDALAKLGFAFIEVGTVTPYPQEGNPKPRLFRIPDARALINRMGLNNRGVDALIKNLERTKYTGILGVNIGKQRTTPLQEAVSDYQMCLQRVYPYAHYVTVNVSSPNTPGLRTLQHDTYFESLIKPLRETQQRLADALGRYVPVLIKLSPDETDEALKRMVTQIALVGLDGVVVTNTTLDRHSVSGLKHAQEAGGLSGRPLLPRALDVTQVVKATVGDALTIIGVGGIDSAESATRFRQAGADLLQIYTGLIYEGPALISRLG